MRFDDVDGFEFEGVEEEDVAGHRRRLVGIWRGVGGCGEGEGAGGGGSGVGDVAAIGGGGKGADCCEEDAVSICSGGGEYAQAIPLGFGEVSIVWRSFMLLMS